MLVTTALDLRSPFALALPIVIYLVGLGLAMPQSMAGALTPFPDRAGAASSVLGFIQQVVASSIGIVVAHMLGQQRSAAGRNHHRDGLGCTPARASQPGGRAARWNLINGAPSCFGERWTVTLPPSVVAAAISIPARTDHAIAEARAVTPAVDRRIAP